MQSPLKNPGFSLIELSIVMAMMSVMATALLPNMISAQRDKLLEATVETYYRLGDAALAYRLDKGTDTWPSLPGTFFSSGTLVSIKIRAETVPVSVSAKVALSATLA